MEEETMIRVMIAYFKAKGLEAIRQKGAGPDLHLREKGVVEVKGSDIRSTKDFDRMLKQLVDYARKFSSVSLALPYDALSLEQAEKLDVLIRMILEGWGTFATYVVAPVSEYDNVFYVKKDNAFGWFRTLMSPSPSKLGFEFKNAQSTIDKAVENLGNYSPNEMLKSNIRAHALLGDHTVTEVTI